VNKASKNVQELPGKAPTGRQLGIDASKQLLEELRDNLEEPNDASAISVNHHGEYDSPTLRAIKGRSERGAANADRG
jgi:hypothetical protein